MLRVEFVDESWDRDPELAELLYEDLYRDFDVDYDTEWRHAVPGSAVAVALGPHGELLGSARLLPAPGERSRQVRQVVVSCEARGTGVGRKLMCALEERAAAEGAVEIWLNARDTAVPFYERLGYEPFGEWFVSELTGIDHVGMRKRLGGEQVLFSA